MADENKVIDLDTLSHFKAKQDLANEQKFKRKDDAADLKGAVRYDAAQALTEQEKAQARLNIGAAAPGEGGGGGGTVEGAVRYDVEQALSDEDKAKARENIGTTDGTWESMPDKPFGINGWVIEWDANPTDTFVPLEGSDGFYKVSDIVPTRDELIGATLKAESDGTHIDMVLSNTDITDHNEYCYGVSGNPYFIITTQATDVNFMGAMTLPFPSAGVWFICSAGVTWTYYLGKGELKKIDKKYLPDDLSVELPEGLVTTDENGLIPASMLPSYVDDVVEGYLDSRPNHSEDFYEKEGYVVRIIPERGKIYIDLNTGNTYRWSGSIYVRMNPDEYTLATTSDIDALFT